MTTDEKGLIVNHKKFHKELERVFTGYLEELRAGTSPILRKNFVKKMTSICQCEAIATVATAPNGQQP
jgi:hypothetical protein